MGSETNSSTPEISPTTRLVRSHGSSSRATGDIGPKRVPSPKIRRFTISIVPSSTANARRWKVSTTGKAHTVSRTVVPSQVLPHHSKNGRKDSLSIGQTSSHGHHADPECQGQSAGNARANRGGPAVIPRGRIVEHG